MNVSFKKVNDNIYTFNDILPINLFYQGFDEFNPWNNNWFYKQESFVDENHPIRMGIAKCSETLLGQSLPLINIGTYVKLIAECILKLKLTLVRVNTNIQFFGQESSYHIDGNEKDYTFLIFLNDMWNAEWGGDFVVQQDTTEYMGFTPFPNMGILFRADFYHKGNAPNRLCSMPRISVAYTFTSNKNNVSN